MLHDARTTIAMLAVAVMVLCLATPMVWAQDGAQNEGDPQGVDVAAVMAVASAALQLDPMGYESEVNEDGMLSATHDELPALAALVRGSVLITLTTIVPPEDTDDEGLLVLANDLNRDASLVRYYGEASENGERYIVAEFGTYINEELDGTTYGVNVWEFLTEVGDAIERVAENAKG